MIAYCLEAGTDPLVLSMADSTLCGEVDYLPAAVVRRLLVEGGRIIFVSLKFQILINI